ncbi:putative NBD/HSP70 family sugar kinase [Nonomuraea polychroma]|uniref:Putative NBD/HSP70 family sugar kinase n=1 Tax=Nonomuraea polychroma TaxID=46176 RepID=A0A438M2D1_9ACTN|nr:ROK family transcriptional regulator [Nonomuraea polychroma]RVX39924.1 putative NBD/HSP70 family sugar kinase [Nonomuraea polychroma]
MTAAFRPSAPRSPEGAVRQENLRDLNLGLVFQRILTAGGPISRTELAAATGLTRPTITRIAEELLAGQLITEKGVTHNGRAGRPRVGLTLSDRGPAGLGLDIRADGLAACVVDLTGTVRHLTFAPARYAGRDAAAVLTELARMAREAVDAVTAKDLTVVTTTLAVPGPVDGGIVRSAPALGWRDVPAGTFLGDMGLTTAVENEANLAALGELYAGDNTLDSFVYVSGGLGIGAGIVLGGHLMRGARGWSGEFGHVTVHPDGAACPCGSRGCLQTYASTAAILGDDPAPESANPDNVVTERAEAGSPPTLAALERAGTALGIALSSVLNILDIDTVLLGGSFALMSSWLTATAKAEIDRRVLTAAWAPVTVRPALLGPDAAVIGAALTSIDQIRRQPTVWLARQA